MSTRPIVALAALAAVLVAVLFIEYHVADMEDADLRNAANPAPPAQSSRLPQARPPASGPDDNDAHTQTTLAETILARPLFRATRRPSQAEAAAVPVADAATLPRLTAVLVSPDGRRAIFAAGADGKSTVVSEGGHVGAFVVQSIETGQVVVVGPDGSRTVRPGFGPATTAAAVAPAPALGGRRGAPSYFRPGPGASRGSFPPGASNPNVPPGASQ